MWIKSLFISAYLTLLGAGAGYGAWLAWQAAQGGASGPRSAAEAVAVVLAMLPPLGFFARLFLWPVARTSARLLWPWVPAAGALLLLWWSGSSNMWAWGIVALVGLGGWWAYQWWYSHFGREESPALQVGQPLPDLVLERPDGTPQSLSDLQGALLLMFYRGNWCPLCMAQISEVVGQYQQLAQRGVQTVLISNQPHSHTEALARRFNVPMHFLVDVGNRVAQQLGIAAEGGTPTGLQVLGYDSDTTMPTVVMTDAQGIVIFCDQTDNYRVRPEPETFLRVLDEAAAVRHDGLRSRA